MELRRGVLVRGRVTEAASGEPVAGARVQYNDYNSSHISGAIEPSRLNTAISGPDGRFELPVPPEPSHLLVLGPTPDYVAVESSYGETRLYADAVVPLEGRTGGERAQRRHPAARGVTLRGRVLGPDDKPAGSLPPVLAVIPGQWLLVHEASARPPPMRRRSVRAARMRPGPAPTRLTCSTPPAAWGRRSSSPSRTRTSRRPSACGHAGRPGPDRRCRSASRWRSTGPQFIYLLTDGAPQRFYITPAPPAIPLEADQGVRALWTLGLFGTIDDGRRRACHLPGPRAWGAST